MLTRPYLTKTITWNEIWMGRTPLQRANVTAIKISNNLLQRATQYKTKQRKTQEYDIIIWYDGDVMQLNVAWKKWHIVRYSLFSYTLHIVWMRIAWALSFSQKQFFFSYQFWRRGIHGSSSKVKVSATEMCMPPNRAVGTSKRLRNTKDVKKGSSDTATARYWAAPGSRTDSTRWCCQGFHSQAVGSPCSREVEASSSKPQRKSRCKSK